MKKRILSILLVIAMVLYMLPTAFAAETVAFGTCGENLTWKLDSEGTLTISGTGDMKNYSYSSAPWYSYRVGIHSLVLEDGITTIGDYTFASCSSLSGELVIPDGVTSIGNSAFRDCSGLTSVTIPDSVTSIGDYAFYYCMGLSGVEFPNSLTSIGGYAFYYCRGLTEITFLGNAPSFGSSVFSWVIAIAFYPAGNTTWTSSKRQNYGGAITWVSIEDRESGVIASGTCGDNLTWVLDSNYVLTISGTGAMKDYPYSNSAPWFSYRAGIHSLVLEDGITSISSNAFYGCRGLTEITFLGDAPSFGSFVFYDATAIAYYPAGNTTWTSSKRQNYGGTITWVAYEPEVTVCPHTSTNVINAKAATCTEKGYTGDTYCNDCKETIAYGSQIEVKAHTPVTDAAVAATCATDGKTAGSHCSVCDTVIVAQKEVPATGHTEEVISGKAATCTEDGLTDGVKCSVCGEILTEQETIPAKGHTGGSVCSECGEVIGGGTAIPSSGDMDMDGRTTVTDLMRLKALLLAKDWSDVELVVGDLNNDGKLNVVDIILVKNMVLNQ